MKAKQISKRIQDQLENFNYHATPRMKKKLVGILDSYDWINAEYIENQV